MNFVHKFHVPTFGNVTIGMSSSVDKMHIPRIIYKIFRLIRQGGNNVILNCCHLFLLLLLLLFLLIFLGKLGTLFSCGKHWSLRIPKGQATTGSQSHTQGFPV